MVYGYVLDWLKDRWAHNPLNEIAVVTSDECAAEATSTGVIHEHNEFMVSLMRIEMESCARDSGEW